MSVKIRDKKSYLYLDIYCRGKRKWEKLGLKLTGDKQQDREVRRLAEQVRLKRELQLFSGEHGLIDNIGAKKSLYAFLEEIVKNKSKKDQTVNVLKHLKQYPDGETIQIKQITSNWIERFQDYLLKESGLSRNSISQYIKSIASALNKAVASNFILKNPARSIKIVKAEEKSHDVLTMAEIQKLYDTSMISDLNKEISKAFIFACFAGGLRISDLQSLKWENIEHRSDKIFLTKTQVKTKKIVKYELNKIAFEIISDGNIHNRDEFIFPILSSTKTNTHRYLKQLAKKANIDKNITWHTARRSNATLLVESGVNITIVQKILGHSSLATTMKYIQVADKSINEAASALPEIKLNKKNTG